MYIHVNRIIFVSTKQTSKLTLKTKVMTLLIIFFFTIGLLPVTFMLLQVMQQKIDFKKHGKRNETYIHFCKRYYTRYI